VLERIYSSFPAGLPGAGLLLLRFTIGAIVSSRGFCHLAMWHELSMVSRGLGLLEVGASISLVLGYLTPITLLIIGALGVRGVLFYAQLPAQNLFGTVTPSLLATAVIVSIGCLGPGAYSVDARLFGRREIIIPDLRGTSPDSGAPRK
jgi:hypothetical protein